MKNSIILWILVLMFGAVSCIDDRGSYDYISEQELLPSVISGLEENYVFKFGTTRTLTATVTGDEGRKNLRYMWYIYKIPNVQPRDTLGFGKTISFFVNCESGNYHVWFEVRDTVADVCVNRKADVMVETVLSNAWLIAESENGGTDVDAVLTDGRVMEDIVTTSVGERLKGNAVKVLYNSEHSQEVVNPDGTMKVEKQKALYILSDQEIRVFNAENMRLLKKTADCFYEAPKQIRPMDCVSNGRNMYIINIGKYHTLSGSGANVGKFSYMKVGPDGAAYNLHQENILANQYTMVFDQVSRSFLWANDGQSELSRFSPAAPGVADFGSLTNMAVKLKHLLFRSSVYNWETYSSTYMGYAIMDDGAGKYYLMDIAYKGKSEYPVKDYKEIPAGCKLGQAGIVMAHQVSPSVFFAERGELWVHDVNASQEADLRERMLLSFPGEEITFLKHVKTPPAYDGLDHLIVLTYGGGYWKLYGFPFIGGGSEIDTTVDLKDVLIAKGKGWAAYCMRLINNYEF